MPIKKDPPKSMLSSFMSGFKQGLGFSAPAPKKKKKVAPKKTKYVRRNTVRSNQK